MGVDGNDGAEARERDLRDDIVAMLASLSIEKEHELVAKLLELHGTGLETVHDSLRKIVSVTETYDIATLSALVLRVKIEQIVQFLEIDKTGFASEWTKLANNFHKMTHRHALKAPTPINAEFFNFVESIEILFEQVLEAFRNKYAAYHLQIDRFLKLESPSPNDANNLFQDVPNNELAMGYFFQNAGEEWLEALDKRNAFEYPGDEHVGGDANWPPMFFLTRMAERNPNRIWQIISSLPSDIENVHVNDGLSKIALTVQTELVAEDAARILNWCKKPYTYALAMNIAAIAMNFLENGYEEIGLDVLEELLHVEAEPGRSLVTAQSRFDNYLNTEIIRQNFERIIGHAGISGLQLFCSLLNDIDSSYLRSHPHLTLDSIETRFALSPSRLSFDRQDDIREQLIEIIHRSLLLLIDSGETLQNLVGVTTAYESPIFEIITFNFFAKVPERAARLVREQLLEAEFYNIKGTHKARLLAAVFPHLTGDQGAIVKHIIDLEEDDRFYWLEVLSDVLSSDSEASYNELFLKFGHFNPFDDVPIITSFEGPSSPITLDEFKALSPSEVVKYLKEWQPIKGFGAPTKEGLSRVLQTHISESPEEYVEMASSFKDVDPTYVRAFMTALKDAISQEKPFPWTELLELISWIMRQPRTANEQDNENFDQDISWYGTCLEIARLLEVALEAEHMPFNDRDQIWSILQGLMSDPDPSRTTEERIAQSPSTSMSPFEWSYNNIRGITLHDVILYSIWTKRNLLEETDEKVTLSNMPEVATLLETTLAHEFSASVMTVLGRDFSALYWVDSAWLKEHIARIFDLESDAKTALASWQAFLLTQPSSLVLLELLRAQYEFSVKHYPLFGAYHRGNNPDVQLGWHIISFYSWWGQITLEDPDGLLSLYMERVDPGTLAQVFDYVGIHIGREDTELSPDAEARLVALWNQRLRNAENKPGERNAELGAFASWFTSGKFNEEWVLNQFAATLKLQSNVSAYQSRDVMEVFEALLPRYPLQVLQCLGLMLKKSSDYWAVSRWEPYIMRLLSEALQFGPEIQAEMHKIISHLVVVGHQQYLQLLRE